MMSILLEVIQKLKAAKNINEVEAALSMSEGVQIITPIVPIVPQERIIRAREVKTYDEIQAINHLSYPAPQYVARYGRANLPKIPVFYGISDDSDDIENGIVGALLESSPCLRKKTLDVGSYRTVCGMWEAIETMQFYAFIDPSPSKNMSNRMEKAMDGFYSKLDTIQLNYPKKEAIELIRFMHSLFTKKTEDERDYWVTAMFTLLLMESDGNIDGVIYKSVKSIDNKLSNTLCVAIKPESVDNKMKFLGALDCKIVVNNNHRAFFHLITGHKMR